MRILVNPALKHADKQLLTWQKAGFDEDVRAIVAKPGIGETKTGELAGVPVFEFCMGTTLCLLAHRVLDEDTLKLLMVGPDENLYRDLKNRTSAGAWKADQIST